MESLFWIFLIAAPLLGVLGWVFWIVVGWFFFKRSMDLARSSQDDLGMLLAQLDRSLRAAAEGQSVEIAGGSPGLPPQQQLQIQGMLLQAQNRMAELDSLSRQRYETRLSELGGMAASAGIDWTPSY